MKKAAMVFFVVILGAGISLAALTRYLSWRVAGEFPPIGTFADIGDVRLHYLDVSEGSDPALPPLIFIHGASGNLRDLSVPLKDRLNGERRVIFVDRPGHGHSSRGSTDDMHLPSGQARIISGLLQKLEIEKAIIVGHSYGGAVAATFGVEHADQTAGLVFLAPATHPWPGGDVTWHYDVTNIPIIGWLFSETLAIPFGHLVFKDGVKGVFKPNRVPENYLEKTGVKLLLRPDTFRNNAKDVGSLFDYVTGFAARYEEISVPVAIITGDQDDVVLANIHSTGLEGDIEGSRLIWLEGIGHAPAWSATEVVVEEIERVGKVAAGR